MGKEQEKKEKHTATSRKPYDSESANPEQHNNAVIPPVTLTDPKPNPSLIPYGSNTNYTPSSSKK